MTWHPYHLISVHPSILSVNILPHSIRAFSLHPCFSNCVLLFDCIFTGSHPHTSGKWNHVGTPLYAYPLSFTRPLPFTLSQVKVLPFSPGIFIPYTFIYTLYPYPKVKFDCDLHPWNTYLVGVLLSVLYFIISMSSIWWASVLHGVRRIFMAASHKLHKYCYELRK